MKQRLAVSIISLCIMLLSGCSKGITDGEVYNKEFVPEKSWVQMIPIVHYNGKYSWTQMVPIWHHHPDEYIIRIRKYNESNNRYKTNRFYTDKDTFDKCGIGDWFEYNSERDLIDEPLTKKQVDEQ